MDSKIDAQLADEHAALRGRAAIANAQVAYSYYLERISHDDWADLAKKGAAVQRLLWASTGTKNPAYSDVRYVELLIGRDTVNTIPPATYAAFKAHGRAEETLLRNIDQAPQLLQQITDAGIDWVQLFVELEAEGIAGFEQAFAELLATLTAKIKTLRQAADDAPQADAETVVQAAEAETAAEEAPADEAEGEGEQPAAVAETDAAPEDAQSEAAPQAETNAAGETAATATAEEPAAEAENADADETAETAAGADEYPADEPAAAPEHGDNADENSEDKRGD